MIKIGENNIENIKKGSEDIVRVYKGGSLIYPKDIDNANYTLPPYKSASYGSYYYYIDNVTQGETIRFTGTMYDSEASSETCTLFDDNGTVLADSSRYGMAYINYKVPSAYKNKGLWIQYTSDQGSGLPYYWGNSIDRAIHICFEPKGLVGEYPSLANCDAILGWNVRYLTIRGGKDYVSRMDFDVIKSLPSLQCVIFPYGTVLDKDLDLSYSAVIGSDDVKNMLYYLGQGDNTHKIIFNKGSISQEVMSTIREKGYQCEISTERKTYYQDGFSGSAYMGNYGTSITEICFYAKSNTGLFGSNYYGAYIGDDCVLYIKQVNTTKAFQLESGGRYRLCKDGVLYKEEYYGRNLEEVWRTGISDPYALYYLIGYEDSKGNIMKSPTIYYIKVGSSDTIFYPYYIDGIPYMLSKKNRYKIEV